MANEQDDKAAILQPFGMKAGHKAAQVIGGLVLPGKHAKSCGGHGGGGIGHIGGTGDAAGFGIGFIAYQEGSVFGPAWKRQEDQEKACKPHVGLRAVIFSNGATRSSQFLDKRL
jgi:hypothetical protein